MIIRKSLLFTGLFSIAGTALSAYVNLAGNSADRMLAQPHWMIRLHIVTAFIGAFLLARFIVGSSAALQVPVEKSSYGVGMLPLAGAVRFLIPGKNGFFSALRSMQLIGIVVCLMVQFVSVIEAPDLDGRDAPHEQPVRRNAADGTLAT
ncbi:hypothetical protein BTH42_08485 [Burkholderia sp. SRS-W-2-2016]|uniref:hypothetical protein n=1 Tax=Burkholderia sp. SRS-W-2-2016 TaxID=1926878 RepID=UPI00094B7072|nr:hypothetical protein [Burkholderia sp. SRS-W-2-2016]OLL32460.1 hypothetical protein BTH42_08485 [Burkholderia sp. SRS-W-2-2016]